MAVRLRVEERLSSLEARMTAVEQLPARMDRLESQIAEVRDEMRNGHVMIVTVLTEQIEESRRHMRLLHEDVLSRFRVVGEKLAAHDEQVNALADKVDGFADQIDAAQGENRAMFEQLLARVEAPRTPPKRKRR